MAFVTLFVPEEFLNIPTHGSIQYHPSLLPAYRGASAINWPIIKGEKETGLSIFWPDNGLDTGDVLIQKKTPIGPTDTLGTVYFDRLFPMGVDAMMERSIWSRPAKRRASNRTRRRRPMKAAAAPDNAKIDWGKPWEQIDRLDPRLQSGARRLDDARRQATENLRRQAAAGERPQGDRRQSSAKSLRSKRTASPWSAPTAASRSPACSPPTARKSKPASGRSPPTSSSRPDSRDHVSSPRRDPVHEPPFGCPPAGHDNGFRSHSPWIIHARLPAPESEIRH